MYTYIHIFFVGYNFLFICFHLQNFFSYLKSTKTHDVILGEMLMAWARVMVGVAGSWETEGAEWRGQSLNIFWKQD